MIKKNEKGRFEVEFYDSITYENGNMICHMKNVDIIVSSKHGLPVTEEDLWRFMSDNNWLEVTGVSKKQDFSYAVNCFNSHTLEIGMVTNDVSVNCEKKPCSYALRFFTSIVDSFADCTNPEIACYHCVTLLFISGKYCIKIDVFPDKVVMVDNLNLYASIEGFVFEQQFFNDYDNSYCVEVTNNEKMVQNV